MADAVKTGVVSIGDDEMTPISKDFFFEGMYLPVAVYMKLNPSNYLMIGKKFERANFASLHSFANPKSSTFVTIQDARILTSYVTELTAKFVVDKKINNSTKVKFVNALTDRALEGFVSNGLTAVHQM